ncbi:MAG: hypothetical protein WCD37_20925 [Chloroflexia bacterium]
MSRIMWNHVEGQYRGQSYSGVILTIDEDAMNKVIKNAGNAVFDTEWWIETLAVVFDHWGLKSSRWLDPATQMPHVHYRLVNDRKSTETTGPLAGATSTTSVLGTGPLMSRLLNSGKLNSGQLDSGKLRDEDK